MRRKFSAGNASNDGVSDSSSQDVYDFGFSQQESSRPHWSSSLNSSSKSKGDRIDVFRKLRKVNVIDVDSEPYGSCSTLSSQGFEVLANSDGDLREPKKVKNADFDPFEYDSSEELDGIAVQPKKKGRENGNFDFLEDGDLLGLKKCKNNPYDYKSSEELEGIVVRPQMTGRENGIFDFSEDADLNGPKKCKNVGSDTFVLHSSYKFSDLGIPRSKKHGWNEMRTETVGVSAKPKKKNKVKNGALEKKKKKRESRDLDTGYVELNATLMETQESEETTEHEDEVNFALAGLKKGQQLKARRASLLSLLSICGTLQRRRILWAHGLARKIIDAIFELSLDDTPSIVAAAALYYLLTSDGQDEHLLYSSSSIRFLLKLLKPLSSTAAKVKSQPIGSKLLGLCKNAGYSHDSAKGTDSTSTELMHKVQEILVNCKEMKPINDSDGEKQEPELNPKWISMLTIEKACSHSISIEGFEEASRSLRRTGAKFKERFRELGGLDAVFEVARKCHFVIEEWVEKSPSFAMDLKNISGLESLALLLKCLKIMENATFLSKDNQCHLLEMKGSFGGQQAPRSFTKLILSVIKILSGVSLLRSSIMSSQDEKMGSVSYGSNFSGGLCNMEQTSYESFDQSDPCLISGQPSSSYSRVEANHVSLQKWRVESSREGLSSGTSCSSNNAAHASRYDSAVECGTENGKLRFSNSGVKEDGLDPFAFPDDDIETSTMELLSNNKFLSVDGMIAVNGYMDTSNCQPVSQQESNNLEYHQSQETPCSSTVDDNKSNLLADCLLMAVKVLMNLSNDNPQGCQQVANCGGLEILSSLIAGHFPSFSLPLPHSHHARDGGLPSKSSLPTYQHSSTPLTEQELDFLVALLGLLVNLVEKDGGNRSRLAAASVSLPNLGRNSREQSNLIPILCSIFLANRDSSEVTGEEKYVSWDDEDSILEGEKEAEKMIVQAYAALLLAFLSTESKKVRRAIAECLPERNLKILVPVLERFVEFHLKLNVISSETHSSVLEVIESCRMP